MPQRPIHQLAMDTATADSALRAREALRRSESRYRRLFETALDGILLLNAETAQIEDVNPFLIRMLGYSHAEFLGKKLWEVGPFADIEESKHMFSELQIKGQVRYDNLPLKSKGGARIAVEFVSNGYDCEGVRVIQCNIRDITERRAGEVELARVNADLLRLNGELETRVAARTADLRRTNGELDAFSYSVAHDLRAPLRAVTGFATILAQENAGRLDTASLGHLARIQDGATHMSELIDALLDLARVSREVPHPVDFDLGELAAAAGAALALAHPEHPVELCVAPDLRAHGDPRLLRILFDNLLGNAWKFSAGRARTRVEVGRTVHQGVPAYFVRDDGPGFDMRYAHRLFDAFQRLHGAEYAGAGIGLSIVQRICAKHGGVVWVESAPGQGATFYFSLGIVPLLRLRTRASDAASAAASAAAADPELTRAPAAEPAMLTPLV